MGQFLGILAVFIIYTLIAASYSAKPRPRGRYRMRPKFVAGNFR